MIYCVSNVCLNVTGSYVLSKPITGLSENQFHCHREIMQLAREEHLK